MANVNKLTPTQLDIIRALSEVNRGVTRKEMLSLMPKNMPPSNLNLSIKPLVGFFIRIQKDLSKKGPGVKPEIVYLTPAGRMVVRAFDVANK